VVFWAAFLSLSFVQFLLSALNASSAQPRIITFLPFQIVLVFFDFIVLKNLMKSEIVKRLEKKFQ